LPARDGRPEERDLGTDGLDGACSIPAAGGVRSVGASADRDGRTIALRLLPKLGRYLAVTRTAEHAGVNERRRRFLLLSVAGSAVMAATGTVLADRREKENPPSAESKASRPHGYRLTAHVQRFYRSAGRL